MATESGQSPAHLSEQLFQEGYRFDFFQAVRLLERMHPERTRVGHGTEPSAETVRFRTDVSLSFPPSAVDSVEPAAESAAPDLLTTRVLTLTGPMGPLPLNYTELILERLAKRDRTLKDFLDVFQHRLISFFYRSWLKTHLAMSHERNDRDQGTVALFSLAGLGTAGIVDALHADPAGLPLYAGLLAMYPRSSASIEALIGDYLGEAVEVSQFAGRWIPLAEDDRTRLGIGVASRSTLGGDLVLGDRFWDAGSRFRLRIGPLPAAKYRRLLPGGDLLERVRELTRLRAGEELRFDVQLLAEAEAIPGCVITADADRGVQLGWTTWMTSHGASRALEGACLQGA